MLKLLNSALEENFGMTVAWIAMFAILVVNVLRALNVQVFFPSVTSDQWAGINVAVLTVSLLTFLPQIYRQLKRSAQATGEIQQIRLLIDRLVEDAFGRSRIVRDEEAQPIWSEYVDEYRAFNATFGNDVLAGRVNPMRRDLHASRYKEGGVTTAKYYLFRGETDDCDELTAIESFLSLISAANETSPAHRIAKERLQVRIAGGPRPPVSLFCGKRRSPSGEVSDLAMAYVVHETLSPFFCDGLRPRYMLVSEDIRLTTEIENFMHTILKKKKMLKFHSFDEFRKFVTDNEGIAKAIPADVALWENDPKLTPFLRR